MLVANSLMLRLVHVTPSGEVRMMAVLPPAATSRLPLEAMAWRLTVSGQSAVSGRAELADTIPAKQNASVRARIHIGAGAAPALASAIAGGAVTYPLDATFTFRTQIGALSVETSTDGTLRR